MVNRAEVFAARTVAAIAGVQTVGFVVAMLLLERDPEAVRSMVVLATADLVLGAVAGQDSETEIECLLRRLAFKDVIQEFFVKCLGCFLEDLVAR